MHVGDSASSRASSGKRCKSAGENGSLLLVQDCEYNQDIGRVWAEGTDSTSTGRAPYNVILAGALACGPEGTQMQSCCCHPAHSGPGPPYAAGSSLLSGDELWSWITLYSHRLQCSEQPPWNSCNLGEGKGGNTTTPQQVIPKAFSLSFVSFSPFLPSRRVIG